jgi:predicted DCC family thiol-disulfide oxidoreductase YuxK
VGAVAVANLPVLVFDGDCGFCTRTAYWVRDRLPEGSGVDVEPWQVLDLPALGLTEQQVTEAAWWVGTDRRPQRGHRAIAGALRAMGGGWAVLGRVLTLPVISLLARAGYWLVARYRYKLPGGTPACRV